MLNIDIKFTERDIQGMPKGSMSALEKEIIKKIGIRYSDMILRVRKSSSQGINISGVKGEEKKQVMKAIEKIWEDDSWLPL
ncbi:DinI-like family protein [Arsenophonus nasoniae]|uniref:DinI-like family protein n=2 Tax=Arsenophonus nasoniae TaxID=638 RepID=A0A4P7L8K7_9GAMM|nr:DinI-like family protein [Arsenophonus nasoniae]QBY46614.1 DinI-like family protein [Arsenophonus nasoniae]WGM03397.1 DinI-like family protein [Arsenophonus nasoniae]WGM08347.1 DinI-like family protein [Arsenophonus nasoniae]